MTEHAGKPKLPDEFSYFGFRMRRGFYFRAQAAVIIILTIAGAGLWAYSRCAAPETWLGRHGWQLILLLAAAECIEALAVRWLLGRKDSERQQP